MGSMNNKRGGFILYTVREVYCFRPNQPGGVALIKANNNSLMANQSEASGVITY